MATNPSGDPNKPEEPSIKDKLTEKLNSLKKNEKFGGLYDYAKTNTKATIAYVLLIIGIVTLFFRSFFGGLLIGIIGGLYYAEELTFLWRNGNEVIEQQGMVKSIVLGVVALAFFISAPGIFIGAALSLALRYLFAGEKS